MSGTALRFIGQVSDFQHVLHHSRYGSGQTFGSNRLSDVPAHRTAKPLQKLDNSSLRTIAALGFASFGVIVLLMSGVEFVFHAVGWELVVNAGDDKEIVGFGDIVYFNVITILTVRYGDYRPTAWGKPLSVLEAFLGVGLFGVLLSVLTVKLLLPPRNTVVFAKFAYYCTKPQRFLVTFVNTSNANLGNVEISSYFKLGGDWHLKPAVIAPFITQSVQTFYVDHLSVDELLSRLREGDCLRIGLTAGLGFTSFSTSIQYHTEEILVISDRAALIEFFEPLRLPNFTDPSLGTMFHYKPEGAPTLEEYVKQIGHQLS